ncbi:uncharacterized protein PV09_04827 [Verruconis gallopava]|uniref:Uncharacterized protein n=1 Tax=Verruconis gallopava TaxID=253628 RepID=A0A0D2AY10_9PEZI|nr:uncharacterized protein PV09_04827 [Verruconis gallopava]KIW03999.1 hypothetical protein PV09_04827 [Verruconis gallopava]
MQDSASSRKAGQVCLSEASGRKEDRRGRISVRATLVSESKVSGPASRVGVGVRQQQGYQAETPIHMMCDVAQFRCASGRPQCASRVARLFATCEFVRTMPFHGTQDRRRGVLWLVHGASVDVLSLAPLVLTTIRQ